LIKRECDNNEVGINLIEDILKRVNSSRFDEFIMQIFNSPESQHYELFKSILYSKKDRNALQVYNILNLAKAFEKLFTKVIKGDLISKMLSYTDNSYKIILSRIEELYQPILKNRDLKKGIANELAILLRRLEDDEANRKVIIDFAKQNSLFTALKNASKEHNINIESRNEAAITM
jgi:hypothetical protein